VYAFGRQLAHCYGTTKVTLCSVIALQEEASRCSALLCKVSEPRLRFQEHCAHVQTTRTICLLQSWKWHRQHFLPRYGCHLIQNLPVPTVGKRGMLVCDLWGACSSCLIANSTGHMLQACTACLQYQPQGPEIRPSILRNRAIRSMPPQD
jgi:hypothetical protein